MNIDIPHRFIAIEGNIGAGKTTLCNKIAEDFNCQLVLEGFADNPFLPYFYDNPERYAFTVELFFMAERHKQLQGTLKQGNLFSNLVVADYIFLKTSLFAKNNLNTDEYRLFQRLFSVLNASFPKPDLLVFLHRPVDKLIANIKKRGRAYEQDISADYLQQIQNTYFEYFKSEDQLPILIIDVDDLDFANDEEHYGMILETIGKTYLPGVHHISFVRE